MTTHETPTSETKSLAQQVVGRKTPIAIAVAEYIKSLLHGSPSNPYIFSQMQTTRAGVITAVTPEVGSTASSEQNPVPTAANDRTFQKAA